MAKAQATTGIRLDQFHKTGRYALNRPGRDTALFDADSLLSEISAAAGLSNGYWLRDTPTPTTTTWTWVQL